MLNDPIIAQDANAASKCAWLLGEALLQDRLVRTAGRINDGKLTAANVVIKKSI